MSMARREVIDCDRCQAKSVPDPVRLSVRVGWSPDPAGGSREPDIEDIDLCPKCAARLLAQAVGALGEDEAAKWVKLVRGGVKA